MRWRTGLAAVAVLGLSCLGACDSRGDAPPTSAPAYQSPTELSPPDPWVPEEWGWPAWLGESDLADAAAITVVTGATLGEVREAFGAVGDPVLPWDENILTPDADYYIEPWAAFAEVPGGVVVVEPNGFVGSNSAVLEKASAGGLAMVVYWNVELDTAVTVGENGTIVGDVYAPDVGDGRFAELAGALDVPTLPDAVEAVAWGLRAQPAITGIELTEELWAQMTTTASAYQLKPPDWS